MLQIGLQFFNQLFFSGQWQQYKVTGKILRCKNKLMQKQTTKTAAPSINSWANFRQVNKKQTFREDNFIFISSKHYLYNTSHISAEDSLWSNISWRMWSRLCSCTGSDGICGIFSGIFFPILSENLRNQAMVTLWAHKI